MALEVQYLARPFGVIVAIFRHVMDTRSAYHRRLGVLGLFRRHVSVISPRSESVQTLEHGIRSAIPCKALRGYCCHISACNGHPIGIPSASRGARPIPQACLFDLTKV